MRGTILDECSLKILEVLRSGPLSSSELKEHIDVTWVTYSNRLKWLLKNGLVQEQWVVKSKRERPLKVYSLTEKGRKFFELGKKLVELLDESRTQDVATTA